MRWWQDRKLILVCDDDPMTGDISVSWRNLILVHVDDKSEN